MLQQSEVDFMQAFAYLLPVNVVNHLLGTTLDLPTIRRWSLGLTAALDHGSPEDFQAITPDIIEMQEYFKQVIVMRELKQNEKNDWISGLIKLKQSDQLTLDELISTCIFLMLAGHETVQLTIGLGLMTLLKNPQQQLLLQENPELISSAVEEILRFDSPLNKLSRWTSEEIVLNDITIPKNQLVVGMLNAANRDPLKYTNPDKFDITRTNNRHLTFGCGIHNCLGALLARIELQVALAALLPHLHKFTLIEDQIVWLPNTSLRYLFKMMITIKQ
jgi:pimeloyl-[acyl-carrier protein] synthase